MANSNLTAAKTAKNDEFYTELSEIQAELRHYSDKFCRKTVFCNCDDPFESNFVKYFLMNFNRLGLKELIATGYKTSPIGGSEVGSPKSPYVLRIKETKKYLIGDQTDLDVRGAKWLLDAEGPNIMTPLIGNLAKDKDGNQIMEEVTELCLDEKTRKEKKRKVKHPLYYEAGDFRSDISIELLKESDIVVTNPPFSLFREYVAQLMQYGKQFLIMGNVNAITYKEFFPLLKDNKVWAGFHFNKTQMFVMPDDYERYDHIDGKGRKIGKVPAITWFTNIDHEKRHQILPLDLGFTYHGHEDMYPKYDNYDAINVDKVSQIPCDYEPCWYKCPKAAECEYAKTEGKVDKALCENSCNGELGVPITYMDKHCPEQFDIVANGGSYSGEGSVAAELFVKYSQTVNVERERERETQSLQAHHHPQEESVTESSESQSHSLTNTVQNSSELSPIWHQHNHQNTTSDTHMSPETKNTQEFSFRKCNGVMGVPITFLDKYCPEQFEIVGASIYDDTPCRIDKDYRALGFVFLKADGKTESGSGALRDKTSPKIYRKGASDYSIGPNGEILSAVYARILVRSKNSK